MGLDQQFQQFLDFFDDYLAIDQRGNQLGEFYDQVKNLEENDQNEIFNQCLETASLSELIAGGDFPRLVLLIVLFPKQMKKLISNDDQGRQNLLDCQQTYNNKIRMREDFQRLKLEEKIAQQDQRNHLRNLVRHHLASYNPVLWDTFLRRDLRNHLLSDLVKMSHEWVCQICGREGTQVHHITPLEREGPDISWNIIVVCQACHDHFHEDDMAQDSKTSLKVTRRDSNYIYIEKREEQSDTTEVEVIEKRIRSNDPFRMPNTLRKTFAVLDESSEGIENPEQLRIRRDCLNLKTRSFINQLKTLSAIIQDYRKIANENLAKRDTLNQKVQDLKNERVNLHAAIDNLHEKLREFIAPHVEIFRNVDINHELEIQNHDTDLNGEDEDISEIAELEEIFNALTQEPDFSENLMQIADEVQECKKNLYTINRKLINFAQESQSCHMLRIEKYKACDQLRKQKKQLELELAENKNEADKYHELYLKSAGIQKNGLQQNKKRKGVKNQKARKNRKGQNQKQKPISDQTSKEGIESPGQITEIDISPQTEKMLSKKRQWKEIGSTIENPPKPTNRAELVDPENNTSITIAHHPIVKHYHGTPLIDTEFLALSDLEQLLRKAIPMGSIAGWAMGRALTADTRYFAPPFGFLASKDHVTHLSLPNMQLSVLPESLGYLTSLAELHLPNNTLVSLPETLGQLQSLKKLNLEGNPLISLSDTMKEALRALKTRGCLIIRTEFS